MKLNLPESVYSPQDIAGLIIELHDYNRWFSSQAILKRTHASLNSEQPSISSVSMGLINSLETKNGISQHDIDELISTLEKLRSSLPVITVTLAAPATRDVKKTIVIWCRKNISDNILVNFGFNATLLGGMVIRSGSHIFDWSFKRQILENRAKFPEVLKNV